jgi:hypothetical protein
LEKNMEIIAVKAVDEWELEVRAIPFHGMDSDGQYFDENTRIMEEAFSPPLAIYQHGVEQGGKELQKDIVVVGKTKAGSLEKRHDGWYLRLVLDKAVAQAKDIMEAAWKGLVAVSSDSIAHLARLQIGDKVVPYEKNKAGRIAVWPLAGISLWEMGNGNFKPASQMAIALPAMKAIYREAGLPFPEITDGVLPEAEAAKRAREKAKQYLSKYKDKK